jgi:hemoglobin/transferrin/lactoferrin receptor protein
VYADGTSDTWRNTAASTVGLTVGKKWNDMLDLSWEVARSSKNRDSSGAALADFTVHNLRATYKPQAGVLEGTEVRFGIENALNLDYTSHLSSATRKAPGRSVSLTISALF